MTLGTLSTEGFEAAFLFLLETVYLTLQILGSLPTQNVKGPRNQCRRITMKKVIFEF